MSSRAGLHLIARCVGPSVALLAIAGFSTLSWVTATIAVRALGNQAM
jgi:hypothetical protein